LIREHDQEREKKEKGFFTEDEEKGRKERRRINPKVAFIAVRFLWENWLKERKKRV